MSVSGLSTSGWLTDVLTSTLIVEVQPLIGVVVAVDALVGTIAPDASLVGVLSCAGEPMTDIELVRGDSRNFQVTIYESDGVTPVDLTDAIVRFAIKERHGQTNNEAKVWKASYSPDEIDIVDAVNGICIVRLRVDDTLSVEPGRYQWEVELNRRGTFATNAGSLSFVAGTTVASASGVDFALLRVGQIIVPAGALPGNAQSLILTGIDASASTLSFYKYDSFSTESGVSFDAYQGDRKTPGGLSGLFVICPDVVR